MGSSRQVRQEGTHCIRILIPCIKKLEDEETGEEVRQCYGFKTAAVFRAEDTDGDPLPEYTPNAMPELRLLDVAARFDVDVSTVP